MQRVLVVPWSMAAMNLDIGLSGMLLTFQV
jgi:hypothetical protein